MGEVEPTGANSANHAISLAEAVAFVKVAQTLCQTYPTGVLSCALQVASGAVLQGLIDHPQADADMGRDAALDAYARGLHLLFHHAHGADVAIALRHAGRLWAERGRGDPAENQEQAIACFEKALALPPEVDPRLRAETLASLGDAYAGRRQGDPAENLAWAIACWEEALEGPLDPTSDLTGRIRRQLAQALADAR